MRAVLFVVTLVAATLASANENVESPDGNFEAYTTAANIDGTGMKLFLRRVKSADAGVLLKENNRWVDAKWSPDSRFLAVIDHPDGHISDVYVFGVTPDAAATLLYHTPDLRTYDVHWEVTGWNAERREIILRKDVKHESGGLTHENVMARIATEPLRTVNTDYITPEFTFSPDHRYGVMIPVWHDEGEQEPDDRMNKVVELGTNRIVAVIHADPGYNLKLNFHKTAPPHWSADSSVLLWKVEGKWFPDALVLLRLENGKEKWQVDLMKTAQREILARTRKAAPKRYAAAKDANSGNGSAYPEGFTVDVISDEDKITFPYHVLVDLTANPKDIDNFPANLESHLDAIVGPDGTFTATKFKLGRRFQ